LKDRSEKGNHQSNFQTVISLHCLVLTVLHSAVMSLHKAKALLKSLQRRKCLVNLVLGLCTQVCFSLKT